MFMYFPVRFLRANISQLAHLFYFQMRCKITKMFLYSHIKFTLNIEKRWERAHFYKTLRRLP